MRSLSLNNLRNLGGRINVPIRPDEDGYLGKECPIPECLGYFKVTPGTGITGPAPCHCPYCGHTGDHKTFFTREQIEYAKSVAMRRVTDAVHQDLKSLEFEHRPKGAFGIGISLKVEPSSPRPIRWYREKKLETEVVCDACALRYAIYGVFAWCPDCGTQNSLQILQKNLELAKKELILAAAAERDLAEHLIGDALENAVSALDGFGRQVSSQGQDEIRFQNLQAARRKVQERFGFDPSASVEATEWEAVCCAFQKRHLLAHKMGVVDEDYPEKVNDPRAVVGRKVTLTAEEVSSVIGIVERLGRCLYEGIHGSPRMANREGSE